MNTHKVSFHHHEVYGPFQDDLPWHCDNPACGNTTFGDFRPRTIARFECVKEPHDCGFVICQHCLHEDHIRTMNNRVDELKHNFEDFKKREKNCR